MRFLGKHTGRAVVGALCAGAMALAAAPAAAAPPEPDLTIDQSTMSFEGACGLTVDVAGLLYTSEYYSNTVDVFDVPPPLVDPLWAQISSADPFSGPCGLSLDGAGRLYVNNYHRNVARYIPAQYPLIKGTAYGSATVIDSSHPTGVAADPSTAHVYVNNRTYISRYGPGGAGPAVRIGEGSLGDGYGLAVSGYPGTRGFLYAPDHSDDTVKVFDPGAADPDVPVATITGPPGGFGSLRDSAISVDRVTGEVYVADTAAYPQYTEFPEATICVFDHTGAYEGRLKYNIVDASPPGLAVDNSNAITQGRVYVTSGNTVDGKVIAYPPGSATDTGAAPLSSVSSVPSGEGSGSAPGSPSTRTLDSSVAAQSADPLLATASAISQRGSLRVKVSGRLAPKRLPRRGVAPISVSVGGEITTTDGSMPPQLKKLRIELNRNGVLDFKGLPTCRYSGIQPGSSSRALSSCRAALVGKGAFTANITLAGQEPYPTKGRLLVFNGVKGGKPVLYGHIYSGKPFATSFVIVFRVQRLGKGPFGTALDARLPKAMDAWGRLTSLEMTLARRYSHMGSRHSFISAGCPAPKGFSGASFDLARTSFYFDGGKRLSSKLDGNCQAKG